MKISIVTAVYNRVDTIGQAIGCVQSQTHRDIEHIIQDGGSTDGTLAIVEGLADERTRLVSERDKGLYDALNRGVSRATGDVVGFMHSDDFFANDDVIKKIAELFNNPDIDGVYGDLQYVAKDNTSRIIRNWKSGTYTPAKLRRGWMPPHPTLYLRRGVYERFGLYDRDFRVSADYDAMLRYLLRGQIKLAYYPEVVVKMRVGGASNGSIAQLWRKTKEDVRAANRNGLDGVYTVMLKNLRKFSQARDMMLSKLQQADG